MAAETRSPISVLRELVNGYRISQAIRVAAALGIADLLADGPRTSDDLAAATSAHPDALYRLLRALAAAGIFHEEEGRRFGLTPVGDRLRRDAPESLYGWIMFDGGPTQWQNWGALEYSVRTGENGFRHVYGIDSWTYRQQHPELGAEFDLAMFSLTNLVIASLLPIFDFGRFSTIVDVGGGNGALLAAVLARYPDVRGVLFDQEHVVAGAGPVLEQAGVADRCEIVGGDFFREIPASGDAFLLKSIIHDWEDEESIAILGNCRQAMAEGAALLLVERELGPANDMKDSKFSDLNMLLGPGGRERSVEEYARLLEATGFAFVGVTRGTSGFGIFEGIAR
jgi:hypothetical protein